MKVAYFGIDALADCLRLLLKENYTVVRIFTTEGDDYDRTDQIRALARENDIPVQTARASEEDVRALVKEGVALSVTAGYPWRIPTTDSFMQLNIHPSFLPEGRGPWPMPVAILQGRCSGVTLHKISERLDEGDIVLRQKIFPDADETLITLQEKLRREAVRLLAVFLENPGKYWAEAQPQRGGEYWPESTDEARTIFPSDDAGTKARKLRAFAGYGCLCLFDGIPWETDGDGVPVRPYFRPIRLSDRAAMEEIRRKYKPALSDYTFALLWCWRKPMGLSVCLGEDFFCVRGDGYYFFPVGPDGRVLSFLRSLRKSGGATLRFCDERMKALAEEAFVDAACRYEEDDCDYVIENEKLTALAGGALSRLRNDLHHYSSLQPPPVAEPITERNIDEVAQISRLCRLAGSEDGEAESEAIRCFFALGLEGILVRRDGPVSFAIRSAKDDVTVQGHFSKCAEHIRGGALYAIVQCSAAAGERFLYTDLEDDLGDPGLRRFKRSLKPEIIPSYTIVLH